MDIKYIRWVIQRQLRTLLWMTLQFPETVTERRAGLEQVVGFGNGTIKIPVGQAVFGPHK